jgi:hypothetical protein
MFAAGIMTGVAYVASPVARFISVEVIEGLRAPLRHWAVVAVSRIVAVVNVAEKAGVAVEPGAGPDEDAAIEPIGPIVAIGCAIVGRIVKVPIGAHGRDANADRHLGCRCRRA